MARVVDCCSPWFNRVLLRLAVEMNKRYRQGTLIVKPIGVFENPRESLQ